MARTFTSAGTGCGAKKLISTDNNVVETTGLDALCSAVIEQAIEDYVKRPSSRAGVIKFFTTGVHMFSDLDNASEFYLGILKRIDNGEKTCYGIKKEFTEVCTHKKGEKK